jgi:hypothetical protein
LTISFATLADPNPDGEATRITSPSGSSLPKALIARSLVMGWLRVETVAAFSDLELKVMA